MPTRGARDAPRFNESEPRGLSRFFMELEDLFRLCNVTSDEQKKKYALKYVDYSVEDFWSTLPSYTAANGTYVTWRDNILTISYPRTKKNNRFVEDSQKTFGPPLVGGFKSSKLTMSPVRHTPWMQCIRPRSGSCSTEIQTTQHIAHPVKERQFLNRPKPTDTLRRKISRTSPMHGGASFGRHSVNSNHHLILQRLLSLTTRWVTMEEIENAIIVSA